MKYIVDSENKILYLEDFTTLKELKNITNGLWPLTKEEDDRWKIKFFKSFDIKELGLNNG